MENSDGEVQQHDSVVVTEEKPAESHSQAVSSPDERVQQPEANASTDEAGSHPLEPDGKRFKQVWSRAKDAEYKLQAEREERARLEGELKALKERPPQPTQPAEREYTWAELQKGIDEGKISLAQAMEHRERIVQRNAERTAIEKAQREVEHRQSQDTIQRELDAYKKALPAALQVGTPERTKLEGEFAYLVKMGYDQRDPRTELLAARAAFGDVSTVTKRQQAQSTPPERDTMRETASPGKPAATVKDPLAGLTPNEKKHYEKMLNAGAYKSWDEVRAELNWTPPGR